MNKLFVYNYYKKNPAIPLSPAENYTSEGEEKEKVMVGEERIGESEKKLRGYAERK